MRMLPPGEGGPFGYAQGKLRPGEGRVINPSPTPRSLSLRERVAPSASLRASCGRVRGAQPTEIPLPPGIRTNLILQR